MSEEDRKYFFDNETVLGLKVDVDTWRGTLYGLPRLARVLSEEGLRATFFLTVGRDNMGRHVWRLLKPKFFFKMLRGNASKLYGLDILFKGFLWKGPHIGEKLKEILRMPLLYNHEVAIHALDHHKWQIKMGAFNAREVGVENEETLAIWKDIFRKTPSAAGNPGWQISEEWLKFADSKAYDSVLYRSDARGNVFGYPKFNDKVYNKLQIPTSLPTYDEVIGKNGVTNLNYNDYMLSMVEPGRFNTLTIHAEVEGIAWFDLFVEFIQKCKSRNIKIISMGDMYNRVKDTKRIIKMSVGTLPGREGRLATVTVDS